MVEEKSAEQTLVEFKQVLGEEFGQTFYLLHNDLVWLFVKWQQFQKLYETNTRRIEIMNKTAPFVLRIVQITLWESVVLNIARLLDPPESFGKPNLSIKRLEQFIEDKTKKEKLSSLIDNAETFVSFARDWRNRQIAHRDLELAMNTSIKSLAEVNKDDIDNSLKAIKDVFNYFHSTYFNTTFYYDMGSYPGDANNLLYYLLAGWSSEQKRFERMENGTATEEDYISPRAF